MSRRQQPSTLGFTLVEILVVSAILGVLATIAIPNTLRARTLANESAAIANLHTLMVALEMYRSDHQSYPVTVAWQSALYGSDCNADTEPVPDYGPDTFCHSMHKTPFLGYRYTYNAPGILSASTYSISADPITPGISGTRSFYLNHTGAIRHCEGAAGADVSSAPIHKPPHPGCP